jgi:DNA-binding transcriptional MerR regulator
MKYSIGEFSIIMHLSIKSLRLYHEKEILIPFEVDEFSGYRYYNDANFETARAIKILKGFDFTLAEIKEILNECGEDKDILDHLEQKLKEMTEKIHHYQEISRSIELIIQREKEGEMKTRVE